MEVKGDFRFQLFWTLIAIKIFIKRFYFMGGLIMLFHIGFVRKFFPACSTFMNVFFNMGTLYVMVERFLGFKFLST